MANIASSRKSGRPTASAGYDGTRSSEERPSRQRATTERDYYEQHERGSRDKLYGERRDAFRRTEEAGYSGSYASTAPPPPQYGYRPSTSSGDQHYSSAGGISYGKRYTPDDVNYGSYARPGRDSRERYEERGRPRNVDYDARDRAYPAHNYTSRAVPA